MWREISAEEFLFGIPLLRSRPAVQICISVTSDDVKGILTHLPPTQLSHHCSAIVTLVALHPSHTAYSLSYKLGEHVRVIPIGG